MCEHSMETWSHDRWTTYQRMDPWHLTNILAQRQPLEGISNWPLKFLLLTLSQISFVLTMQNIIFPILADWYFAYETMIRQTEGMDRYSFHQGTFLFYLMNFIIKITPPCEHFKMHFQFPESNTTNFLVFLKCKIIIFLTFGKFISLS